MINIKVNNIKQVTKQLNNISNLTRSTTVTAMNRTLYDMLQAEKKEITKVFDRPVGLTKKAVKYDKAEYKGDKVDGKLYIIDFFGKGTPPSVYLYPHIFGGEREVKRSEYWLREKGLLPSNKFIAPAPHAKLNQYGNIRPGQMTKILSGLKAFDSAGFDANITEQSQARNPKRNTYFVSNGNEGLPAGIWERLKVAGIRPLLWFVSKPRYKKRYHFYGVGITTHKKVFDKHFNKAWSDGIKRIIK